MNDKYVKVIYQTPPIGEYGVILELTTFDWKAYERDKNQQKVQQRKHREYIEVNPLDPIDILERRLNSRVDEFYRKEIEVAYRQLEWYMQHSTRPVVMPEWRTYDEMSKLC